MRRGLLGILAALALGSVSPAAFAADMAPAPEPVAVGSWTGFYLGGGGGVGWADIDINHRRCWLFDDGTCDPDWNFHHDFNENSDANAIGIVQGGFDYEIAPSFVVGVGADATFGDILNNDNNHFDDNFGFHDHFENNGSTMVDVYGRAGFAPIESNLLVYGLVGWSWLDADTNFRVRDDDGNVLFHHDDNNNNINGITFGGGLEWKFADWPLSLRAEYRFTDLDNFNNNGNFFDECGCNQFRDHNDVDLNVQRVLFTLNWRFGGFGATTAAAY
jgi:outer membrane immunogenic protein